MHAYCSTNYILQFIHSTNYTCQRSLPHCLIDDFDMNISKGSCNIHSNIHYIDEYQHIKLRTEWVGQAETCTLMLCCAVSQTPYIINREEFFDGTYTYPLFHIHYTTENRTFTVVLHTSWDNSYIFFHLTHALSCSISSFLSVLPLS